MRTTLTIDDDVAAKLKRIKRDEPEKPFKVVINEILRRGLNGEPPKAKKRFRVEAFHVGLREGLSYDNIEELLDIVEGPYRK
ncbi:MAG: hypothetical protein KBD94_11805 [Pyrinomonadaceae bacterium]|nr:hypothetical protein [Pyrinomonadaceae bacterium]